MTVTRHLVRYLLGTSLFAMLLLAGAPAHALTSGETYTVLMSRVNSNGTVTELSSTTAVADSDGKITFGFSGVPTSPGTFFLVFTVEDSSGTVVRKSFVPAPPEGGSGALGANSLSTTQTEMILQALAGAGTDDPVVVAYGLILTRTPNATASDIANIAILGQLAIMNGFETFLTSSGVTAAQLETFKEKLIYNQPNKDLSNFTALFKSAVDNPAQAADDMAMAAGLIADIFIDAGVAAGIDLGLIQAAHDAAGDVVENNPTAAAAFAGLGVDAGTVIDAAMSNFFMRIAAVKVKTSYSQALTTLNASGAQVNRFNTAVQAMVTTMQELDKQYAQYYSDPSSLTPTIRNQMDAAYSAAFNTFQTDIASTNAELTQMKADMASALGIPVGNLPPDLGTYQDFNGSTVNWPIPQVVASNWVASILSAGGSLVYDRVSVSAALPIPTNMNWLNNPTWPVGTGSRTDFVGQGLPASFAALMGMQEDVQIAENTRYYIWDPSNPITGGNPTRADEKDTMAIYKDNVELITLYVSGTTDGSTAITDNEKNALVKMMEHPELN